MAANLKQYLEENPHRGFNKAPHYYVDGDHLTFFASEERCFSQRVNELLTVYVSTGEKSLVGCKVKGVKRVMEQLKEMHVIVCDQDMTLSLLFMSVAAITDEPESRDQVREWGKKLPAAQIPKSELPFANAA